MHCGQLTTHRGGIEQSLRRGARKTATIGLASAGTANQVNPRNSRQVFTLSSPLRTRITRVYGRQPNMVMSRG
jgi:hypothetical protein